MHAVHFVGVPSRSRRACSRAARSRDRSCHAPRCQSGASRCAATTSLGAQNDPCACQPFESSHALSRAHSVGENLARRLRKTDSTSSGLGASSGRGRLLLNACGTVPSILAGFGLKPCTNSRIAGLAWRIRYRKSDSPRPASSHTRHGFSPRSAAPRASFRTRSRWPSHGVAPRQTRARPSAAKTASRTLTLARGARLRMSCTAASTSAVERSRITPRLHGGGRDQSHRAPRGTRRRASS